MKYEVWATQGQGSMCDGEFNTLEEALDCVRKDWGGASFGIKKPDGSWHKFEGDEWKMPHFYAFQMRKIKRPNARQKYVLEKYMR